MNILPYKKALQNAVADWEQLTEQEKTIAIRKSQLKETIAALRACAQRFLILTICLSVTPSA